MFRRGWTCVGVVDDVARPGSFMAVETGAGLPLVITRDAEGVLHGMVNVCRHRGGPLASGCGAARALSCAYHAWVYRLDGSLARASGMEGAEGFDPADHHLYPVSVATWARFVFVHPDPAAPPLDLGPLAAAIDPYPLDGYELAVREQHEREFNWKVLVENYSENFHTPFVHPSLIVADWDYPIATEGAIALAWDRPRHPRNQAEEALASARPGDAAWAGVAANQIDDVFIAGIYFTVFPNLLVSTFPRYLSALHLTPLSPTRTRVAGLSLLDRRGARGAPRRGPRRQPGGRRAGPRHLRGGAARLLGRGRHERPPVGGPRARCAPRAPARDGRPGVDRRHRPTAPVPPPLVVGRPPDGA